MPCMPRRFDQNGIRFTYPENWKLEREETATGWTITVQSPDTAFLVISYDAEAADAQEVATTALEALKQEYPSLEAEEAVDTVAGLPALGYDVRFFSFDLTNTCWIRSIYAIGGTLFLMWQLNDLDLDQYEPVLKAMCVSLQVDE